MSFPNFPGKHGEETMITPQRFLAYLKSIGRGPVLPAPEAVIFCYQSSLWEFIQAKHKTAPVGFPSHLLSLEDTGGRLGVVGKFGIGAPIASTLLEECIALGVKRFISVGTAGALQKDLAVGDIVVCERAIRDEGTSHHYLPGGKYAHASAELTDRLCQALASQTLPHRRSTSWTTDAPYRETIAEARHYQQESVATVEMEAAALFAVATHRKVPLASLFTISDSLADLEWRPDFYHEKTASGLEKIYEAAKMALLG